MYIYIYIYDLPALYYSQVAIARPCCTHTANETNVSNIFYMEGNRPSHIPVIRFSHYSSMYCYKVNRAFGRQGAETAFSNFLFSFELFAHHVT